MMVDVVDDAAVQIGQASSSASNVSTSRTITRLWVGGSSCLTQTYFNNFVLNLASIQSDNAHDTSSSTRWILVGKEPLAPDWMASPAVSDSPEKSITSASSCEYKSCDLTDSSSIAKLMEQLEDITVDQVLLSVRPPLVTHRTNAQAFRYAEILVQGISELLTLLLIKKKIRPSLVIHISSIAAIDHLNRQHLRSEKEEDPPSATLRYPYDWFKRRCEEEVARICCSSTDDDDSDGYGHSMVVPVPFTNLRFGAIFSDSAACIQCRALGLQALAGPYLTVPIDCNSSRNAASLIRQILMMQQDDLQNNKLRPVYYYTRPLLFPEPVPYGEYLVAYRKAHNLYNKWYVVWLPNRLVGALVAAIHCLAVIMVGVPYLQSIDYLLQVTCQEHSFDCSAVAHDFPNLIGEEETMEACFKRRRRQQQQQQQQRHRLSHTRTVSDGTVEKKKTL